MTDPKLRDLIKRQSREAELLIFSYTGSLLATHRKKKKWKKETYFTSLPSPVWFSSEYRANGRNTFIEYVPPHSAKTKNAEMQTKGLWWAFSCHGLGGWAKESRTDWGGDVPDGQMLAKGEQQWKSPPNPGQCANLRPCYRWHILYTYCHILTNKLLHARILLTDII